MTITEGGYNISDITGEFDAENPNVVRYLEPDVVPRTTFGLVTEALEPPQEARVRTRSPSCRATTCRTTVTLPAAFATFARLRDPDTGRLDRARGVLPDSMVDRITPVTTDA